VAGSPADANVILVAVTAQGLFRSENGGRSWTLSELPDSLAVFFNARMAFASASRVYLVSPYFVGSGLYRFDDAGRTFTRLSSLTLGAIAVDPTNPDVLYVGDHRGTAGLFKSIDAGQTLEDLGRPGSFSALAVDWRNPQVIYAGEHFGHLIRSRDAGAPSRQRARAWPAPACTASCRTRAARSWSGCEAAGSSRATTVPRPGRPSTPARLESVRGYRSAERRLLPIPAAPVASTSAMPGSFKLTTAITTTTEPGYPGMWASSGSSDHFGFHSGAVSPNFVQRSFSMPIRCWTFEALPKVTE
jgi:hypothetical protein